MAFLLECFFIINSASSEKNIDFVFVSEVRIASLPPINNGTVPEWMPLEHRRSTPSGDDVSFGYDVPSRKSTGTV